MSKKPECMILELDNQEIYIEVTDSQESGSPNDNYQENFIDKPQKESKPGKLDADQLKKLLEVASKLFDQFKALQSDEMEISFSIKADAETSFFWIAKTNLEGQFGVKLKWTDRNKKDK